MKDTVYSLVTTEHQADAILQELRNLGFKPTEISVLLKDAKETGNISLKENVVKGAESGGLLGGVLGGLAGLTALTIPGAGVFLVIGPFLTALGGAAVGGMIGGLAGGTGALSPLGIHGDVEKYVRQRLDLGDILIAVHSNDRARLERAAQVFRSTGADELYYSDRPAA
jgi:hypothetical protein